VTPSPILASASHLCHERRLCPLWHLKLQAGHPKEREQLNGLASSPGYQEAVAQRVSRRRGSQHVPSASVGWPLAHSRCTINIC
jgi:hypothetical protein